MFDLMWSLKSNIEVVNGAENKIIDELKPGKNTVYFHRICLSEGKHFYKSL